VIEVVDKASGRGVPLVQLRTTSEISYWTDSAGVAAIDDPTFFGQEVFFHVWSHGYEYPKDGFGYRGARLRVLPGGSARVEVERTNVAERLYRVTGGGIYRDSVIVGREAPIKAPLLNAQVLGSDSVQNAVYGGKLYWFWGDTNRPSYPLGSFHVPGATSTLPSAGGLDPDKGVDLAYFVDPDGFAAKTCEMPGAGPTWIFGTVVIRDGEGKERLLAGYAKIKPPMEVYERGLVEWDDGTSRWKKVTVYPSVVAAWPEGNPLALAPGAERTHVTFCVPFPVIRVPATVAAFRDAGSFEAFTPLVAGTKVEEGKLERDASGTLVWGWKSGTPAVPCSTLLDWVTKGKLTREEARFLPLDAATGKPVAAHAGMVIWNAYRNRYVMIFNEIGGSSSMLGEVWYAEANQPLGPWGTAVKVATHDKYSFYNPRLHPEFSKEDGKILYFEGTYSMTFSRQGDPTPRYDYNQIMYRLDVADPWLAPARGEGPRATAP
jgi:hypothetical protein